jgi:hypothetical protein
MVQTSTSPLPIRDEKALPWTSEQELHRKSICVWIHIVFAFNTACANCVHATIVVLHNGGFQRSMTRTVQ